MSRLFIFLLLKAACQATVVPRLTFVELTAEADRIVTGRVVRSFVVWGPEHKFIWTRYELAVEDTMKGPAADKIIVSSPGGTLDSRTMYVAGALVLTPGEHVTLFLKNFPSGDLMPVGWSQGKFTIDSAGKVHGGAALLTDDEVKIGGLKIDGVTSLQFRKAILAAKNRKVLSK